VKRTTSSSKLSPCVVSIDGEIVPPERATVSVFDRGFLYGDAVFEVMRAYRGVPFALGEHVARLRRSAERVAMHLPVDELTLAAEIGRAIEAAHAFAPSGDLYLRLVLTRGSGPLGLDADLARKPLRVLIVTPVTPPPREAYVKGISAILVRTTRDIDGTAAAGAKATSYLAAVLAMRDAKARGAAEAFIVDARGFVVEGATSNVFVVKGKTLTTPNEGILAGITRAHVLDAARARHLKVRLASLRPSTIARADEVFITSSIREIVPVVAIDGKKIARGRVGKVTRALHRELRARAGMADAPMPWE